jgi:hypothetical protein
MHWREVLHLRWNVFGTLFPKVRVVPASARTSMTQRYAHIDNDPLRRASEDIGNQRAWAMGELPTKTRRPSYAKGIWQHGS